MNHTGKYFVEVSFKLSWHSVKLVPGLMDFVILVDNVYCLTMSCLRQHNKMLRLERAHSPFKSMNG